MANDKILLSLVALFAVIAVAKLLDTLIVTDAELNQEVKLLRAFEQGRLDCANKKPRSSCPYQEQDERDEWHRGYDAAIEKKRKQRE